MIVSFHKDFIKGFKKVSAKTQKKFQERLIIFEKDEFNLILNNHGLTGRYKGLRSINVTGDIRAVFKRTDDEAIFVAIDNHSNLYR